MALKALKYPEVGIPVKEVGERIVKLNEALRENNMCIASDTELALTFYKDESKVKSIKIEVYLFEGGDKKEEENE